MTPQEYFSLARMFGPAALQGFGLGDYTPGPGLNMGLNAAQTLMGPDMGSSMKNQWSSQTGQSVGDLPDAPQFLSKGHALGRQIGIQAANFIPVPGIGPIVSSALGGFDASRQQGEATNYMAKLFQSLPETRKLDLQNPWQGEGPDISEEALNAIGGGNELQGLMSGAGKGASIGTMILPGAGTAIGAGIGGLVGGIAGHFAKGKAKSRQQEIEEKLAAMQKKVRGFVQQKQEDAAMQQQAAAPEFNAAFQGNPQMQYIMSILGQRT